ncbi:YdcF family protein [Nitratireductor sp. CAU 1489]|uniref:YdcF family protein n=1 Tax=Nitratireductor arenosus TaxID=2682096 RepID=A0A844QDL0_9HYPH|nr:YdcF family protein [Nitratireductor arenosus]MVA96110.1 YdcF family protein [Nitratireductor arenosus]
MAEAPRETEPQPARDRQAGARGRAGRFGLAGALLAVLVFIGGFAWFANQVRLMKTPADLPDADAIVVLTGGHFRLNAAVDLLKAGKGERLLISGVNPVARAGDLRRATGAEEALFSCCIDIDRLALDTVGNAAESAKWIRAHAYKTIIVVTNNYHMPRSLLEMRRLLAKTALLPYPVVANNAEDGVLLTKPDALRVLFTEYVKYLGALARGAWPRGDGADPKSDLARR